MEPGIRRRSAKSASLDDPGPVAVAFGAKIRSAREKRGQSLREFGQDLGVVHSHLSFVEQGKAKPSRKLVLRIEVLTGSNGELEAVYPKLVDEWDARNQARTERRKALAQREESPRTPVAAVAAGGGTNPQRARYPDEAAATGPHNGESSGREDKANRREAVKAAGALLVASTVRAKKLLHWAESPTVGPLTLDEFDESVVWLSEQAELLPVTNLLSEADRQSSKVSELLWEGRHSGKQRMHLELLAGQLAYFQGRFAFRLGHHKAARAHLRVAKHYGQQLDHHLLLASSAIVEGGIAYYQGRHAKALEIIQEAGQWATERTAAQLAAEEARVYGSLDPSFRREMDAALKRAERELPDRLMFEPGAEPPFGHELFVFRASQACVRAGDDRAEAFAREAIREYKDQESRHGDRANFENLALSHLNLALALVQGKQPEPREAARLGIQALSVAREFQTDPVRRLANELLMLLWSQATWRNLPAVRELAEVARTYRPLGLPAPPSRPALNRP
jgi:transcriptional regulator with XRE-family HTH domain